MEAFSPPEKYLCGGCEATKLTQGGDTATVTPYSSDGEDGTYFDLEFALPEEEPLTEKSQEDEIKGRKPEHEGESTEQLVPVEASTVLQYESDNSCKFPVSILKSAAKFGVVLLKLKKPKPEKIENMPKTEEIDRKFFAFKFKADEVTKMPFTSLFSRENDSKREIMKQNAETSVPNGVQEDRKHSNMKTMKPLCARVSKGYVRKLKFYAENGGGIRPPDIMADGTVKVVEAAACGHVKTSAKQWMQMGLGLQAGKSRSVAVAEVSACNPRRDDSLLQVQDGIQGAILHCKRSLNPRSVDA